MGYCYTTTTIANYVRLIHKPFLLPLTAIEGAIGALSDKAFIEKTVATVKAGRQFLYQEFDKLQIQYWPSQANFILIDPPLPEMEFTNRLMDHGIMVRPVSQFGAPGKVRITVGDKEANTALVAALKKIKPA